LSAGVIVTVAPGSLASRAGLRPGDRLLAISRQRLRDVIDVQVAASEEALEFSVERAGHALTLHVERRYGEALGLEFEAPIFDRLRRCNNRCDFCFVAQLPRGLRGSLYLRDDDYRTSFLFGSYVTLTNLREADWARIAEQHLSPLYVSVHATELALRRQILGSPAAPDVLEQLTRLAELGIEVHTQIVLQPGVNDGVHLERSLSDLARLYPAVRSVSVVPVGLTRFHRGHCRVHTLAEMRATLEQVQGFQAQARPALGVAFAYLSDEWYLRLGEDVPPLEAYDSLDLSENGVGLVRRFLESGPVEHWWDDAQGGVTLVTGTLFAPTLARVAAHRPEIEVRPVVNRFFGETVSVAGLLTARDVVDALRTNPPGERIVLPEAMFRGPDGQTLDGLRAADIQQALGRPVAIARSPAARAGDDDG
jgi:putative radical SAM enzyme (TIGR03279 family)